MQEGRCRRDCDTYGIEEKIILGLQFLDSRVSKLKLPIPVLVFPVNLIEFLPECLVLFFVAGATALSSLGFGDILCWTVALWS